MQKIFGKGWKSCEKKLIEKKRTLAKNHNTIGQAKKKLKGCLD
jgi:hypothetical protein